MKRAVVILRFGRTSPTRGDMEAMKRLTGGSMEAMGCHWHAGLASVIYTDLKLEEIKKIFNEVENEVEDFLPVMIFNWGETQFDFKEESIEGMLECVPEFVDEQKQEITLTLDEILDKIAGTGIESLDEKELALLKSFSKGEN